LYATIIKPKKNQKERARGTSKQSSESSNRIAQDMYATKQIPKKNQKERARETSKQSSESSNRIAQEMTQQ
jgi:hypothetical protein